MNRLDRLLEQLGHDKIQKAVIHVSCVNLQVIRCNGRSRPKLRSLLWKKEKSDQFLEMRKRIRDF